MTGRTASRKKVVLFVGGFQVPKDGTEGGQVFACRSLVASPLTGHVEWKLIDSTQRSEPPPAIPIRILDAAARLWKCGWCLVTTRVDIVFVFSSSLPLSMLEKGLMCIVGRTFRKRVVLSIRFHPFIPKGMPRLYRHYVRFACNSCDKIMTQNRLAADDLVSLFGVDQGRVEVVHNWVDTKRFYPTKTSNAAENTEAIVKIIFVGWLHPHKGLKYLLKGIGLLARDRKNFHLTIAGEGVLGEELRELTKELDIEPFLTFAGWIPNARIPDLLNQSDVFVFPTLHEGMPNALLQAMACGLPVVTTNVSGIPEIAKDGLNGHVVPPESPEAICRALLELIDRPTTRREMGDHNWKQILENHDIESVWPQVGRILGVGEES